MFTHEYVFIHLPKSTFTNRLENIYVQKLCMKCKLIGFRSVCEARIFIFRYPGFHNWHILRLNAISRQKVSRHRQALEWARIGSLTLICNLSSGLIVKSVRQNNSPLMQHEKLKGNSIAAKLICDSTLFSYNIRQLCTTVTTNVLFCFLSWRWMSEAFWRFR